MGAVRGSSSEGVHSNLPFNLEENEAHEIRHAAQGCRWSVEALVSNLKFRVTDASSCSKNLQQTQWKLPGVRENEHVSQSFGSYRNTFPTHQAHSYPGSVTIPRWVHIPWPECGSCCKVRKRCTWILLQFGDEDTPPTWALINPCTWKNRVRAVTYYHLEQVCSYPEMWDFL